MITRLDATGHEALALIPDAALVLDVGGAMNSIPRADWVLDMLSYESRFPIKQDEHFNSNTWIQRDACDIPWPFEDKKFDFSFCSQTLEDVRDPIVVCSELIRVSKAGWIGMPHRDIESAYGVRGQCTGQLTNGYFHHRWFCEVLDGVLVFTQKTCLPMLPQFKRNTFKLTWETFLWEDSFPRKEQLLISEDAYLRDIKRFDDYRKSLSLPEFLM